MRVGDFLEGADLERYLVDEYAVLVVCPADALGGGGVNGGKGMVVGPVRGEDRDRLAIPFHHVGLTKPQNVHIEPACHVHIGLP